MTDMLQVWPAPASRASAPCPSCTATPATFVTTPAETTSPTGCPPRRLFPWCPSRRVTSSRTSAAARCVRLRRLPLRSTARTSRSHSVPRAGAACGSATPSSWWVVMTNTDFCHHSPIFRNTGALILWLSLDKLCHAQKKCSGMCLSLPSDFLDTAEQDVPNHGAQTAKRGLFCVKQCLVEFLWVKEHSHEYQDSDFPMRTLCCSLNVIRLWFMWFGCLGFFFTFRFIKTLVFSRNTSLIFGGNQLPQKNGQ